MADAPKLGRRGFLEGAGVITGAAMLLEGTALAAEAARASGGALGPGAVPLELVINGEKRALNLEPRTTLVQALRDACGLTGTKIGCDRGACGACTVLLDGQPAASCLTFALDARGRQITTVEGLAPGPDSLSPLQAAFVAHDALQCGFCTPGMVMSCHALLQRNPHPSEADVRAAVAGNLCRCGTYPKVFEAALAASGNPAAAASAAAAAAQAGAPGGAGSAPAEAQQPGSAGMIDRLKGLARGQSQSGLQVGLAGALAEGKRLIPKEEPAAWDGSAHLTVVGARVPRIDGAEKVSGRARYSFDLQLPGMLHAAVVRSPHAHAKVLSIDLSAAEKLPGVRAAVALERVLGPAELRLKAVAAGRYPLVRYEGQPVAAVAATNALIAEDAARLVKVKYEVRPAASDLVSAQEPGAPQVFEGPVEQPGSAGGGGAPKGLPQKGNVRGPLVRGRPKSDPGPAVEKGLAASDAVIDETYRTEVQTHSAIETHGVVADYRPDRLEVHASTQGIFTVREELETIFEMPGKVQVHCVFTGGGFGAKFGAGNHGVLAAMLSKKAKAPVRLFLDRRAEHLAVGNRPSSLQHLKIGAQKDGTLTALDLDAVGSAGCAAGAGCAGPANNLYPFPAVRTSEADVFLHAGPAAAFRAPGHPQGAFALEQAMDELAYKLGLDPVALRDLNDPHPARREERRLGKERIGWAQARAAKPGQGAPGSSGPRKRGVGFAQGLWYNFDGPPSAAEVELLPGGKVICTSGVADIGGGVRTLMAQVVAEVLGLEPRQIEARIGDTAFVQGPSSGGSMTTQLLTPAVRQAAEKAKSVLLEGGGTDVRAALRKLDKPIKARGDRAKDYGGWNDGGATENTIGGAQFAEVEVDTETGQVRVLRVVAAHDCGRPVNRLTLESQINGGVIQGISFALHEERILDRQTGRMVNPDFEHYRILGSKDVPVIETIVVERFLGRTNTDASGIGEPATVPTAAAIANAIFHACGARMRSAPITPARLLAALGKVPATPAAPIPAAPRQGGGK